MKTFEISTHVETLEKLKQLNLSSIGALYLGDPTCLEYQTNLSNNLQHLKEAIDIAKEFGVKVYLSTFAVPRNRHLGPVKKFLEKALSLPLDGIEVHNMGLLRHINKNLNYTGEIHVGFFANIYTHESVKVLEGYGVTKVFLNPELSLEEIQFINENTNAEVIIFAHGKLPLGISETCFIKEYASRECRDVCEPLVLTSGKWKLRSFGYATFSGKDWATLEYLGTLYYRGFRTFHIQGLRESPEYINHIANIYRQALENIVKGADNYMQREWIENITSLCPDGICNGYLFRRAGHRYIGKYFGGEALHEMERRERHEAR